jgi:hypothetical protein
MCDMIFFRVSSQPGGPTGGEARRNSINVDVPENPCPQIATDTRGCTGGSTPALLPDDDLLPDGVLAVLSPDDALLPDDDLLVDDVLATLPHEISLY